MLGDELLEEDFGQKVDLTVRINEILQNYASGIAIIKVRTPNQKQRGESTEVSDTHRNTFSSSSSHSNNILEGSTALQCCHRSS